MSAVRAERMTLFTSASAKTEKKKKLGCWNDGVRRAGQGRPWQWVWVERGVCAPRSGGLGCGMHDRQSIIRGPTTNIDSTADS